MLNATDWIIISLTGVAALAAWLLFKPRTRKAQQTLYHQLEQEKKDIDAMLITIKQSARDAEYLAEQLKSRVKVINEEDQKRTTQGEQADRLLERARESELELRHASSTLGERLEQIQRYWDEQLGDTVDSVKQIREQLHVGLLHVDDGIKRMRDQEKMAQDFTQKLIAHYQEQSQNQKDNSELSTKIHHNLEEMLTESKHVLDQIRTHQNNANTIFHDFSTEMNSMEMQASEHFSRIYQSTDEVREELNNGLEEARHHLETLRRREEQSNEISQRIRQQATKVENLNIEQLSKTIESTNKLCGDLQENVAHARQALTTFDDTMQQVGESLKYAEAVNQHVDPNTETNVKSIEKSEVDESDMEKKEGKQLFALRSYR